MNPVPPKMQPIIEELALSGSVSFPGLAGSTVQNKARAINSILEAGQYSWRVKCDAGNRAITKCGISPLSGRQKHRLAEEIIDYLSENYLFDLVSIYSDKYIYSDDKCSPKWDFKECHTAKGSRYYKAEYDGRCPCEYSNPDTLTMTFEGGLYDSMNYDGKAYTNLDKIAAHYGLYHEMGTAYSTAFYPD